MSQWLLMCLAVLAVFWGDTFGMSFLREFGSSSFAKKMHLRGQASLIPGWRRLKQETARRHHLKEMPSVLDDDLDISSDSVVLEVGDKVFNTDEEEPDPISPDEVFFEAEEEYQEDIPNDEEKEKLDTDLHAATDAIAELHKRIDELDDKVDQVSSGFNESSVNDPIEKIKSLDEIVKGIENSDGIEMLNKSVQEAVGEYEAEIANDYKQQYDSQLNAMKSNNGMTENVLKSGIEDHEGDEIEYETKDDDDTIEHDDAEFGEEKEEDVIEENSDMLNDETKASDKKEAMKILKEERQSGRKNGPETHLSADGLSSEDAEYEELVEYLLKLDTDNEEKKANIEKKLVQLRRQKAKRKKKEAEEKALRKEISLRQKQVVSAVDTAIKELLQQNHSYSNSTGISLVPSDDETKDEQIRAALRKMSETHANASRGDVKNPPKEAPVNPDHLDNRASLMEMMDVKAHPNFHSLAPSFNFPQVPVSHRKLKKDAQETSFDKKTLEQYPLRYVCSKTEEDQIVCWQTSSPLLQSRIK